MPILAIVAKFGTYAVMAMILIFALGVVTLRNLFHCALCQFTTNITAWLGSLLVLGVLLWTLVKLNRTFVPEKRYYPLES